MKDCQQSSPSQAANAPQTAGHLVPLAFDLPSLCLILSLVLQTASYVLGKYASLSIAHFTLGAVLTNVYYLGSLACLGGQAITWQITLRKFPLAFAYFFMSILFVNILLLSKLLFHEAISPGNLVGAALIVAGVVLITRNNAGGKQGDA